MGSKVRRTTRGHQRPMFILAMAIFLLVLITGCDTSEEELAAIDYAPLLDKGAEVSTPAQQDLDPLLVAELYHEAAELETIYGLLVVKDGVLIAEDYFNEGSVEQKALIQSAAKSVGSALVGIALDQGCLTSIDQKMVDFFPDYADQLADPRKHEITIRDMLQMRAGFPAEESDPALWEAVWSGDYVHHLVDVPLTYDPGEEFQYSNLTTHWLGVIVARACETDLASFGQQYLFDPLGGEIGPWRKDLDGYNWAAGELHLTARDAAQFGLLYLNDGRIGEEQIVPANWVRDSLQTYSEGAYANIGPFRDIGYGYQWWSATINDHPVNFAWGHGGQLIVLLPAKDMVIVVTADPFYDVYGEESWRHEKANFHLVGDFIEAVTDE